MKIKAYLKPHCGWSRGVRAVMEKYSLEYEDIDIINYPENYAEMVEKSGQQLSPCIEFDGVMLADVSGEEIEAYMLENKLVSKSDVAVSVPLDRGCSHELHEERKEKTVRMF